MLHDFYTILMRSQHHHKQKNSATTFYQPFLCSLFMEFATNRKKQQNTTNEFLELLKCLGGISVSDGIYTFDLPLTSMLQIHWIREIELIEFRTGCFI